MNAKKAGNLLRLSRC